MERYGSFGLFHHHTPSYFANRRWSKKGHHGYSKWFAHEIAIVAHKMLFALLLDVEIIYSEYVVRDGEMNGMDVPANAVAYAEYYGLLEYIAPRVIQDLEGLDGFWEDVKHNATFDATLAQVLRWEDLYIESLRHLAALHCLHSRTVGRHTYTDCRNPDEPMEDGTFLNSRELKLAVLEQRDNLIRTPAYILEGLQALTCFPDKQISNTVNTGRLKKILYITFFTAKTVKYQNQRYYRNTKEKLQFLARSIFSQWLNVQLTKIKDAWYNIYCKSTQPIHFYGIVKMITRLLRKRTYPSSEMRITLNA